MLLFCLNVDHISLQLESQIDGKKEEQMTYFIQRLQVPKA